MSFEVWERGNRRSCWIDVTVIDDVKVVFTKLLDYDHAGAAAM